MPFESARQERWMWANEPGMAQRWYDEHGHAPGFKKGRKKKMKKSFRMRVLGEEGGLVLMKAETEGLKRWRRKQKRGAIMRPETFSGIEAAARKEHGPERAKRIAGAAYWKVARAKHDEAVKSATSSSHGGERYLLVKAKKVYVKPHSAGGHSVKGHFKMDTRSKKAGPEAKPERKERAPSAIPKALADAIGRVVDRITMASEGQAFAAGEKTTRELGAAGSADKDFQERQKRAKEAGAKADQGAAKAAKK